MIPESSEGHFSLTSMHAYIALGEVIEVLEGLRDYHQDSSARIRTLSVDLHLDEVLGDAELSVDVRYDNKEN